jgi:hypothetical protein
MKIYIVFGTYYTDGEAFPTFIGAFQKEKDANLAKDKANKNYGHDVSVEEIELE